MNKLARVQCVVLNNIDSLITVVMILESTDRSFLRDGGQVGAGDALWSVCLHLPSFSAERLRVLAAAERSSSRTKEERENRICVD